MSPSMLSDCKYCHGSLTVRQTKVARAVRACQPALLKQRAQAPCQSRELSRERKVYEAVARRVEAGD
jgi:hypothetical protein